MEERLNSLVMSDWPAADGPPLRHLSVGEALRDAAGAAPDAIALVEGCADPAARRRWTYRELLADAERTGAALLARFSPGERVAIWANNRPEWVLLEYGAALAGITIVTVNPALRGDELRHVLANSGAQGLFMLPGYRGTDMQATLAGIRAELPGLREVVLLTAWDEFLSSGRPGTDLPGAGPDDPAQIQYTSGTTGQPKGAVLRHAGITDNAALYAQRAGLRDGDVTVNPMPLFHTAGCVMSVLGTLSVRGTVVLPPAFDPALQLQLLEQERGTSMIGVPTMLIAMLDAAEFRSADLSSLRRVISGGAVVPAQLVRRVERETPALVSIVFAQTESSPVITQTSPDDRADDRAETLGRPLPHTAVRIVSTRTGQTLPVGQTGELLTRGYAVMLGYNNDPAATAAAIDPHGWLHTGDLAKMDERGYFRIDGRLKEMIIRGGENIYPREIEAVLFGHPDVADVAVVGIPDERWGEQVAAFVRPAAGHIPDPDALFAYVRARLAPFKTPRFWAIVDHFPMTGSAKIQKFRLQNEFADRLKPVPQDTTTAARS
ncbi:MAG TPA: AMP-binding protein [Trebonia sp.]|nr:AMP-binding protein [Trebonia sp.]